MTMVKMKTHATAASDKPAMVRGARTKRALGRAPSKVTAAWRGRGGQSTQQGHGCMAWEGGAVHTARSRLHGVVGGGQRTQQGHGYMAWEGGAEHPARARLHGVGGGGRGGTPQLRRQTHLSERS